MKPLAAMDLCCRAGATDLVYARIWLLAFFDAAAPTFAQCAMPVDLTLGSSVSGRSTSGTASLALYATQVEPAFWGNGGKVQQTWQKVG